MAAPTGPRQFEMVLDDYEMAQPKSGPTTAAPYWAWKLMRDALCSQGWTEGMAACVRLDWSRRPKRLSTSGRAWWKSQRIYVRAGSDETDLRMVVLHETAHLLTPRHHHDLVFWRMAWRLYLENGIPVGYAVAREGTYRRAALQAARELGIDTRGWERSKAIATVREALNRDKPAQVPLLLDWQDEAAACPPAPES